MKNNLLKEFDCLNKALDTSRLRRVRTTVRRKNGTVYQKTVYKKEEELEPEARRAFMAQDDLEQMGSEVAGKRVSAKWIGSSTGAKYECDWLQVDSFNDQNIVLKFTQDFQTNNRSNYIYRQGTTITIPRTNNPSWSKDNSVKLVQETTTTTTMRSEARTRNNEIQSFSDISVGDEITIKEGGVEKKITVRRLNIDRVRGYNFIVYKDEDGSTKQLKFGKRGVQLLKQDTSQPQSFVDKLQELKQKGIKITIGGVPTRVVNGTTTTHQMVRVDRFGNRNPRGGSRRSMPITENTYRNLTDEEMVSKAKEKIEAFQYKEKLDHFNFEELTNGFQEAFRSAGMTLDKENVKFTISPDSNTMTLNVNQGSLRMTRIFYLDRDSVYHKYFSVGNNRRGDGIGKQMFKNLYKQYKNIGIKKITVSANIDTGCYAWAAYGFSASQEDADKLIRYVDSAASRGRAYQVQQKGSDGVKRMVSYTPTREDVSNMKRVLESYYTNPINTGKTIPVRMLTAVAKSACQAVWPAERASWSGSLDLTKQSERAYFENYINFND